MTRASGQQRMTYEWEDLQRRSAAVTCQASCPFIEEGGPQEGISPHRMPDIVAEDWSENLRTALRQLARTIETSETSRMDQLERRIAELEDLPEPIIVPINTFAPEPFEPIRTFFVVVEPVVGEQDEDHEYIATFVDAEIAASGDTVGDAVLCLKDQLLAKFDMLEQMPQTRLGSRLKRQLVVLQSVIRRVT